ncbi:MAG: cytidine deaminase [Actinobacteria bacterium]|nr:MAG: cytidine deaminase [Actinomycetota bacterium]
MSWQRWRRVPDIDEPRWEQLRQAARAARELAYAPYSRHPVGAAALVDDGRVVSGSNVENASLGVTLCAECSLVGDLVRTGGPGNRGRLVALACVGPNPGALLPCGRCRQLLFEHGGTDLLIDRDGGPVPLSFLLPDGFGPDQMP